MIGIFLSAVSQVILKKASMKTYPSKVYEYLNFPVISAYIIFIGTTLISIYAYKGIPLSLGSVLEATSYIYITFFGLTLFQEKLNLKKTAGLLLIIGGILIYSLLG